LLEFYPYDFSGTDLISLDIQLQNYIVDMRYNYAFLEVKGIGDLARKMVETKKGSRIFISLFACEVSFDPFCHDCNNREIFSAMKYVKNQLRNQMGDQWMNDCLFTYIETDVFDSIENESIMQRFQNMKTRRGKL
jgi:hypothetical protein